MTTSDDRKLAHYEHNDRVVAELTAAYPNFLWRTLLLVDESDPLDTSLRVECLAAGRTGICDLTPAQMLNDLGPAAHRRLVTNMGRNAIGGWLLHEVDG